MRNITVSPQTGIAGGRADLRGVAAELDALIVASSVLPSLPGKFAFVLDDGRVVAEGTHRELLESSETYQEIVESQLSVEEAAA